MALGLIKRFAFIPFAASVAFAPGCSSGDDDSSKGCTKDTDCIDGRVCDNGTCKDPGGILGSGGTTGGTSNGTGGTTGGTSNGTGGSTGGTSNGTGGTTGGTSNGTGGSGAKGGTGGSTGGSGGSGGSSAGTSGTGGGASGAGGACTSNDPILCPSSDSTSICVNGSYETFNCDYFCTTLGFPTGPCTAPNGCACDTSAPSDQACNDGVSVYCTCVQDSTMPCDSSDPNNDPLGFYIQCHVNDPTNQADDDFLRCLGMQIMTDSSGNQSIDCQAAGTTCGATSSGTGGSGGMGGMSGTSGAAGTPAP
jgi:hypothetical protein